MFGYFFLYFFLELKIANYYKLFDFLNTKNLKKTKLIGEIIRIGINFAILGSSPVEIRTSNISVLKLQKNIRLVRYFRTDFVWSISLLNDQK